LSGEKRSSTKLNHGTLVLPGFRDEFVADAVERRLEPTVFFPTD
jgi:hypothetical protein